MATIQVGSKLDVLAVKSGSLVCALPLEHVRETMRPLPIEALAGAPTAVLGVSRIRGAAVPVVDLRALLDGAVGQPTRFVSLQVGARGVALAVEQVLGVRSLDPARVASLPPVLTHSGGGALAAIGELDQELCVLLSAARLYPAAAGEVAS